MQAVKESDSYNAIDLGKFICSVFIMMIHVAPFGVAEKSSEKAMLNYFFQNYLARIAVPFFFVATGFLLFRKMTPEQLDVFRLKRYIKRIARLYVIWTILYLPMWMGSYMNDGLSAHIGWKFLKDFLIAGSYAQLWYLRATVVAVAVVSYLLYKKISVKTIVTFGLVLYCIGLTGQSWYGLILPLRNIPVVWNFLKLIKEIIGTTRNGIFEGILFVSMGVYFAYTEKNVSTGKAFIGFLLSMLGMLFEVVLLEKGNWVYQHDMYLFLIPVSFFGFAFVKGIKLQNHWSYKMLRTISSLNFYLHFGVALAIQKTFQFIGLGTECTSYLFILTVFSTLFLSIIIILLSKTKRVSWIQIFFE